ncbi:MAG TPA: cold-shock protein [Bdellovibrionota bacterium]|nr:cold-shock protein [Bdellovibrionota bacterium]
MVNGTVKWFNKEKGFGFIAPDDGGRDVYVNLTNVQTQDGTLADGQRVEFEVAVGRKGPEAIKVKSIS